MALLEKAVSCFLSQTYPNKELVILYEEDNWETERLFEIRAYPATVRLLSAEKGCPLGTLRNYAISQSGGDFFCQWDDDDWYHVNRLEHQYGALKMNQAAACVLDSWILFDAVHQRSYISGRRFWEGSLLCSSALMQQMQYPPVAKGEDTAFIKYLLDKGLVCILQDKPQLYIYTYHGNNTFGTDHFGSLFECGRPLTGRLNRQITRLMEPGYDVLTASKRLDTLMRLR